MSSYVPMSRKEQFEEEIIDDLHLIVQWIKDKSMREIAAGLGTTYSKEPVVRMKREERALIKL